MPYSRNGWKQPLARSYICSRSVEMSQENDEKKLLAGERWELLRHIDDLTEKPLVGLSVVWLVLITIDLVQGLSPPLQTLNYAIWSLFLIDFVVELVIAPHKGQYFKSNWLTAISLVLPAFRVLRLFQALRWLRVLRATRSLNLVRLITSLNRGMRATRAVLRRHNLGYVLTLTLLVVFAGAAGMAHFEPQLASYGDALWWTAMVITTMGSEYWPQTAEGRILCLLMALYAFAIFGYITATLAILFLGKETGRRETNIADEIRRMQLQIVQLQDQISGNTKQ